MTQLKEQMRFKRRLLAKIAMRARAGDCDISRALLDAEIGRFLKSHKVQSATLYDIWKDAFGQEEAFALWKLAQRKPIVPFDYRRFRAPPVVWHSKARSTIGHRKVCSFHPIEKLWHALAHNLIVAQHVPRPHIGDWLGRGRDWQIAELKSAITSSLQGVVVADIRSAFASVNPNAIYDLHHLPEPLIRRAIDYRTHRFVSRERSEHNPYPHGNMHRPLEVVPSGLMEGSPASNAIFSVFLDDLPDHLGEGIEAFVYCDNIVLLAPNMLLARKAHNSLVRYLSGHRAGPFEMRSVIQPVTRQFDHIGYSLWFDGKRARVTLSPKNWSRYVGRLDDPSQPIIQTIEWLRSSFSRLTEPEFEAMGHIAIEEAAFRANLAQSAVSFQS